MKESVLKSKVQRSFDRSTQDYSRDTVRREGQLIHEAASLLKEERVNDALNLLLSTPVLIKQVAAIMLAIGSTIKRLVSTSHCCTSG